MPEGRLRERVRCSSLVDWPIYPRLRRTMLTTPTKRNPFAKVDLPPSQGVRLYEPVDALRATVVYWRCVLVPDAGAP